MGRCTSFLCYSAAAWLVLAVVSGYFALQPEPCAHGTDFKSDPVAQKHCVGPLFEPTEKVDVYFFTSYSAQINLRGADVDDLLPVWNRTGVTLDEALNATLQIPAQLFEAEQQQQQQQQQQFSSSSSSDKDAAAFGNGLHLHVFVVRAGFPADPRLHSEYHQDTRQKFSFHRSVWPRAEFEHLLHTSLPLTRTMVPIRQARRSLLSTSTSSSSSSSQEAGDSSPQTTTTTITSSSSAASPTASSSQNFSLPAALVDRLEAFGLSSSGGGSGGGDYRLARSKIQLSNFPVAAWAAALWIGLSFAPATTSVAVVRGGVIAVMIAVLDPQIFVPPPTSEDDTRSDALATAGRWSEEEDVSVSQTPTLHVRPRVSLKVVHNDNHVYPLVEGEAPYLRDEMMPTGTNGGKTAVRRQRFHIFESGNNAKRARKTRLGGHANDGIIHRYQPVLYAQQDVRLYEYVPLDTVLKQLADSSKAAATTPQVSPETEYQAAASDVSPPSIKVHVELSPQSLLAFQVLSMMEQTQMVYKQYGATEADVDELKSLLSIGLWKYAVVQVIGVVQLVLQMLAFKNDISFFRGRQDYSGMSSRSLLSSTAMSLIIFLYLLDNEFTSRLVLYPLGLGVLLDLWKVKRQMKMKVHWQFFQPWVTSASAQQFSAGERVTDVLDSEGMFYLQVLILPLIVATSLYALKHYTYKSWWSWAISSLADASYMFGFVNMTPQIFINYKLKSVAHMPWRVMIYKAFNTFIDDLVAFSGIFPMPAKHQWMTLRDDLVFFVFLCQRWMYRTDYNRADEFGFVYEAGRSAADETKAAEPRKELSPAKLPPAVWASPTKSAANATANTNANDANPGADSGHNVSAVTPTASPSAKTNRPSGERTPPSVQKPGVSRQLSLPASSANFGAAEDTFEAALDVPLLRRSRSAPVAGSPNLVFSKEFEPTCVIRDAVFGLDGGGGVPLPLSTNDDARRES